MIIAPSILAANFARLGDEVVRSQRAGADWLHLDVMDGHFVPNLTLGPDIVRCLRPLTKLFFDAHLMCSKPEILIEPFIKAGADQITIHVELGAHQVTSLIWKVRSLGKKVGLAINPPTSMALMEPYVDKIDTLLVMAVNPGFGGQSFITETLPKMQQARAWRAERKLKYHIQVDGGINFATAADCARAGADNIVSGTGLFKHRNLKAAIKKMRATVEAARAA